MALTLDELKGHLKQLDEVILVDLLQLTSSDIVDKFPDIIERNSESLSKRLGGAWEYDYFDDTRNDFYD